MKKAEPAKGPQTARPVRVVVDVRERRTKLLQVLQQSPAFDLQMAALRMGDYIVEDQVTVSFDAPQAPVARRAADLCLVSPLSPGVRSSDREAY